MKRDRKGYQPAANESLMLDHNRLRFWIVGAPPAGYLEILTRNPQTAETSPWFLDGRRMFIANKQVGDKFAWGQGSMFCEYALVPLSDEQVAA